MAGDDNAGQGLRLCRNYETQLTFILDNLNRGLGLPDAYPFVLSPAAIEKLGFVHEVATKEALAPSNNVTTPVIVKS